MTVLRVASAYPDPPFEVDQNQHTGLDADLGRALCAELGWEWRPVDYLGDNFEGIFAGLASGEYDCVLSGTTVTEHRCGLALFCDPYLESGQSLVVNVERTPQVRSIEDLAGLTLGIQHGNTSDLVARELLAQGKLGDIRYYAYRDIPVALADLEAGTIHGVMKLEPVMRAMTRTRPALQVVQAGISQESIAACVPLGRTDLQEALNGALRRVRLEEIKARWL